MAATNALHVVASKHAPNALAALGTFLVTPALEQCGRLFIHSKLKIFARTRMSQLATIGTDISATFGTCNTRRSGSSNYRIHASFALTLAIVSCHLQYPV